VLPDDFLADEMHVRGQEFGEHRPGRGMCVAITDAVM
jgi:hypothetical protein